MSRLLFTDLIFFFFFLYLCYSVYSKRSLFSVFLIPELYLMVVFFYLLCSYLFYLFKSYFFLPLNRSVIQSLTSITASKIQTPTNYYLKSFIVVALCLLFLIMIILFSLYVNNASSLFSGYSSFGLLYHNGLSFFFKFFFTLIVLIVYISMGVIVCYNSVEILFLVLLILYSSFLLVCSANFILFFTSLELFSICFVLLFFLFSRHYSRVSAIKYFLISAISSIFILLGVVLLYSLYGVFSYKAISMVLIIQPVGSIFDPYFSVTWLALCFLILGFFVKLGVSPFHFWLLEVYENLPIFVISYSIVFSKTLFFFILYSLLNYVFMAFLADLQILFFLCGFLSLLFGSFVLLDNPTIKQFIVFNSLISTGTILLGLIPGSFNSSVSLLSYLVMENFFFLTFLILLSLVSFNTLANEQNLNISDTLLFSFSFIKGAFFKVILVLYCMIYIGIPPFGIFLLKFNVLANMLDSEFWFLYSILFVAIMVLSVTIFVRLLNILFFVNMFEQKKKIGADIKCAAVAFLSHNNVWPLDYLILFSLTLFISYYFIEEYIFFMFYLLLS